VAPLQLVQIQNAAARLVLNLDQQTYHSALQQLHWLPIKYRISFKIATLMHHILHDRCLSYLADLAAFITASSRQLIGRRKPELQS